MKKNIFRKIQIALFATTIITLSSCEKFLDIKPVGRVIPETQEQYRALLANAYARFPTDRGLAMFRSDEVELLNNDQVDVNNYLDTYSWNDYAKNDFSASFQWKDYYYVIYLANYIINDLETKDLQDKMKQILAEAYLLRAYSHFTLVNLFAPHYSKEQNNLPAIPLSLNTDTEAVLKKNTLEEVYKSILEDIESGLKNCNKEQWEKQYTYRWSIRAAEAFKARVYLYTAQWQKAIETAEKIIQKNANLLDLTKSSSLIPSQYDSPENMMALDYVVNPYYERAVKPSNKILALFDNQDVRKRTTFKQIQLGVFAIRKGGDIKYKTSFRTSELYLILAEANAQTDNLEQSKQGLLFLKKHRLRKAYFDTETIRINKIDSKEALLKEIFDERAREFAFEGHRWFDLRRSYQSEIIKIFDKKTYKLEKNDARYTIPIPKEAKENNTNL